MSTSGTQLDKHNLDRPAAAARRMSQAFGSNGGSRPMRNIRGLKRALEVTLSAICGVLVLGLALVAWWAKKAEPVWIVRYVGQRLGMVRRLAYRYSCTPGRALGLRQ